MDLPSVLGGLAQGFTDFGKSVVDLFGTGGAAIGDLLQGTGTRNQDDFRKWLYNTDSVKDAAAKGLGTALNGVQTVSDYIPGINVLTRNPLGNAAQGALGGLADEFKMAGENYDLGRAGQRAAVSGAAALAGSSLGDALKKSANPLLQSGLAQGLARGAAGGAINQGGYAAIDGGDIMQSALQGAGMGALLGGATGAIQDFMPRKVYEMPFTEQEKQARIANIDDQLSKLDTTTPEGNARYNELMQAREKYSGTKRLYRGLSQEYDPNYPTNRLDTSGYESWTDNPELARQYGKNVYYTDVPESDIKTSYMDENPQSETYGDRNLWHSITKPAGLNGVSGTEYLLYMDDPASRSLTRNRLPGGETLDATLADADMAVNSPRYLTDENGNPRTFYHGSPETNITEFDMGRAGSNSRSGEHAFFFTDSPEAADEFSYERIPSKYSMFIDDIGKKGKVYEANLSMNNPLDLDNITDEQIRELWPYASSMGRLNGEDGFYRDMANYRDKYHNAQGMKLMLDLDKLKDSPYDGFSARMYPNSDNMAKEYAVFSNDNIKLLEKALANDDMVVNAAREPEGFTYDYDGSDMAAVQRAYNLATQDQARLDGMLKEISDTLGTEFSSAGQKSMKSMLDKVDRKVRAGRDYTVASMKDHTRGKVMMNSFNEIPRVLEELDRRGVPYETEVVTNDWGYKGYHITFRNPDGISSEIQLTTADHWPAKLESDAIYDKWRNFDFDASTKTERQRYNEAMARSQALWAKVDFSEFDKTVQSLSGTGRALRSVAPVTSKLGLTQEPSLYTKMPSSSESANMSPSSVTRTFSGLGLDRSPNIDTPPFDNIIPQNASRTLEGVLSADDLAVNSAKIAPGQLGLFDDMPTQTPKTGTRQTSLFDQPDNPYLDYYGADIDATPLAPEAPTNPYAPVNGEVTQAMRDRAADILGNWKKNGVPENELYNAINQDTLPDKVKSLKEIVDGGAYDKRMKELFGTTDIKKADIGKVIDYLYESEPARADNIKNNLLAERGLGKYEQRFRNRMKKSLYEAAQERIANDIGANGLASSKNIADVSIRQGYTAAADEALSERLGIAPGNTPKYNGAMDTRNAFGRYSHPSYREGGDLAVFERKMSSPEDAISTVAHERLHSFQGELEPRSKGRYDKEVLEAYEQLRRDLAPHYKSWDETAERYGHRGTGYWQSGDEQESRMLQNYLENKGYTDSTHMKSKYRAGEWGNEINPAFDKFFDKLRDLSKRGVALPALAGLFGGGVVLDQVLNSKDSDKDKKKTKRSA